MKLLYFFAFFIKFANSARPHIIFILADDLGWNDVGFHGSNQIPTPNIDSLAYTGIILNNYYVTPVCTPSRSALMTGKYPIHTGLQHGVIHGSAPYGLSLNETLLPQYLNRNGYISRAVGKWHLGSFKKEYTPEYRGFDSHYGYWVGKQDYYDHTSVENLGYWGYDMRRGMNITWSDYGSYTTDLFTKEAVKIIENHNSRKPLFLYLAHLATHSANPYNPLQAPPETVAKFSHIKDKSRRIFAAMVSKLDDSVGNVVEALLKAKMLSNSIIIFSTDNGGPAAGFNENAASNWPLRGVKDTLWEGGVRGASFLWSPNLKKSKVSNAMMHITDWLPTILSFINDYSKLYGIDGFNMKASLLEDSPSPRQEILLNIDNKRKVAALKISNWKYIEGALACRTWNGSYDKWFGPSGRNGSYNLDLLYKSKASKALFSIDVPLPSVDKIQKIRQEATVSCDENNFDSNNIQDPETDAFLFDVDKDPCEKNNLIDKEANILKIMRKRLEDYKLTVVPPRNKPADPRSNPKYWGYAWVNWMDFIKDGTTF